MAECGARLEDDPAERARVWDAIAAEPPPYGFDPAPMFPAGPGDPAFGLLRLDARRVELAGVLGDPSPARTVWRGADASAASAAGRRGAAAPPRREGVSGGVRGLTD